LDGFATSKKFNPLDAENWYSVTHSEIRRAVSVYIITSFVLILFKGGRTLFNYYNGSHIEALVKLYPELLLKKRKFSRV